MAKQLLCQKYILKLNSSRLRKARWKLSLPLEEAMKNKNDLVALGSSQVLRFLDELHGRNTEEEAQRLKKKISLLHKATPTAKTKKILKGLYQQLYELQYQPNYVAIIMDKLSDYDRLNKGFSINGIEYKRFLGTNGGVKNSTILYLNKDLYPLIKERLDCGRDKSMPIVPNKLEAYQALICSASTPVSMPNGIIVVPDCVTQFTEDVISIDDSETDEPVVSYIKDKLIELTESDGYGLMLPSLARRWNAELGGDPDEALSGVNLRGLPWTKGMVFPFDFIDFGTKIANENYMIKDAWGDWRDVREAELILTTSMLKLWDSYTCWEHYWDNVQKYRYQISIAKTAPHQLENERCTNYQFLQNYEFTDEEIQELVQPTIQEIKDAMGLDWRKSILFLRGKEMTGDKIRHDDTADFAKALMIEPTLINDPFVRGKIYSMIKKKIRQAKIGVLNLKGNFAIIGGDPYSLCQNIFGLPVTGLLKAGETYHHYWSEQGVDEIVCFRAPMTSKYNIRKLKVVATTEMEYWYRDIRTCMLLNSWDSTAEAANGADKDRKTPSL